MKKLHISESIGKQRHSRERGNPEKYGRYESVYWIPAFAGMTLPVVIDYWFPAFAGKTLPRYCKSIGGQS